MDGILIVNKPKGWTSHDVVGKIRHIAQMKKVGHAGTLDPIATGVLVVLLGKATKLSDILLQKDKTYRAGVRLGLTTDTAHRHIRLPPLRRTSHCWKTTTRDYRSSPKKSIFPQKD